MKRQTIGLMSGAMVAAMAFGPARDAAAQAYPNKPIRLIVPYAAGGIVDTTARLVQNGLQDALGQPVVIDNRSGAAGEIGSALVAKAPPDGYTLKVDNESHAVNPAIFPSLPYDTEKDFAAVSQISSVARLFVVNVQTPATTMKEFVALAKASPSKYNYANAASAVQLAMELFNSMAGTKVSMVAYRGGAPAMAAMVANETQITLVPLVPALSYIQANQLRALAVAAPQRVTQLPQIPTIAEAGYPDFEAPSWVALFAPTGTPKEIIDRLHAEMVKVLKAPDVLKRFAELGMDPAPTPGPEFDKAVARDVARWTKVARDNNIVAQN
jgi:tripartite-type tricarboxylate transporter receptor subunit TctC